MTSPRMSTSCVVWLPKTCMRMRVSVSVCLTGGTVRPKWAKFWLLAPSAHVTLDDSAHALRGRFRADLEVHASSCGGDSASRSGTASAVMWRSNPSAAAHVAPPVGSARRKR